MRLSRTRLNSASMRDLVVKGIGPRHVGHRHGAIVHEPVVVEHPEHGLPTHGQKGDPQRIEKNDYLPGCDSVGQGLTAQV